MQRNKGEGITLCNVFSFGWVYVFFGISSQTWLVYQSGIRGRIRFAQRKIMLASFLAPYYNKRGVEIPIVLHWYNRLFLCLYSK